MSIGPDRIPRRRRSPATSSRARSSRRWPSWSRTRPIRILDLVFIVKDEEGNVAAIELAEMTRGRGRGRWPRSPSVDRGCSTRTTSSSRQRRSEPNSSAGLLVFENVWATRFAEAVRNADGQLVANERIPYDIVQAALATRPPNPERRAEMLKRARGPGLVRAAATTAVVAGTAGAVRHRQEREVRRAGPGGLR